MFTTPGVTKCSCMCLREGGVPKTLTDCIRVDSFHWRYVLSLTDGVNAIPSACVYGADTS